MFCKMVQYHEKSQQARDIGQFHLSPILQNPLEPCRHSGWVPFMSSHQLQDTGAKWHVSRL
jgi:hypothetical protein